MQPALDLPGFAPVQQRQNSITQPLHSPAAASDPPTDRGWGIAVVGFFYTALRRQYLSHSLNEKILMAKTMLQRKEPGCTAIETIPLSLPTTRLAGNSPRHGWRGTKIKLGKASRLQEKPEGRHNMHSKTGHPTHPGRLQDHLRQPIASHPRTRLRLSHGPVPIPRAHRLAIS